MGDENPIRTLGDYSKPSQDGYMNTIELPVGNNVVPLRSDTIRLDFLKLVDSLDLDGANRERARVRLFQFSLRDQASNWPERLPAGSITTWEDLTTRFLAQFFPPAFLEDLALYDNESWSDPRDSARSVKAISMPQDHLSTSGRCLIKLENQAQCLMEAHLALNLPVQMRKIASSCEIYCGPHDTQYFMENPDQAFVEYASTHASRVRGSSLSKGFLLLRVIEEEWGMSLNEGVHMGSREACKMLREAVVLVIEDQGAGIARGVMVEGSGKWPFRVLLAIACKVPVFYSFGKMAVMALVVAILGKLQNQSL
nr:MAK10-like protein [Tanacetum cinerariifolium]